MSSTNSLSATCSLLVEKELSQTQKYKVDTYIYDLHDIRTKTIKIRNSNMFNNFTCIIPGIPFKPLTLQSIIANKVYQIMECEWY